MDDGINIDTLKEQLDRVKDKDLKSALSWSNSIYFTSLPISKWDVKHITHWANHMKTARGQDEDMDVVEAIAVVRKAVQLNKNFNLTDVQILACLISLNSSSSGVSSEAVRGKLLQVATGEGKSIIVVILAIVNALREAASGRKPQADIITSSPVLAERDAKDKMRLFKMFELSVSFNNDTSAYVKGILFYFQTFLYFSCLLFNLINFFNKRFQGVLQIGHCVRRSVSVPVRQTSRPLQPTRHSGRSRV